LDEEVIGLKDLIEEHEGRIRNGMVAYGLLQKLRGGDRSEETLAAFEEVKKDLGYGLLLKAYTPEVVDATEEQIKLAARDSIPHVAPVFWAFRVMVASGFTLLLIFVLAFYYNAKRQIERKRWLLWFIVLAIPLPWIAIETGWFVAEYGRQPWAIGEVLPTFLGTSSLTKEDLILSLSGFIIFYTILFIIEIWLMFHFARKGPSSLHTGKYHFEKGSGAGALASQPQKNAE
ncbi:MAG TPA: cytochrome bd-I ubiquinol oxidase subunit CydA, partial [Chromatiaceae bacterium]|nr:cytochrome bd-I ubiquinol oxidase subunit CydA [Chromatiaceae bacterium]